MGEWVDVLIQRMQENDKRKIEIEEAAESVIKIMRQEPYNLAASFDWISEVDLRFNIQIADQNRSFDNGNIERNRTVYDQDNNPTGDKQDVKAALIQAVVDSFNWPGQEYR
jgi:hypothetical protein